MILNLGCAQDNIRRFERNHDDMLRWMCGVSSEQTKRPQLAKVSTENQSVQSIEEELRIKKEIRFRWHHQKEVKYQQKLRLTNS